MIYSGKNADLEKFKTVNESASSEDIGSSAIKPNKSGLDRMTVSDLAIDTLGMERNEDLAKDPVYGEFFHDPIVMETFTKHLDLNDANTRKRVLAMNEAEQMSVLTSLTSKLYDNIVSKVDDIDFGEIPMTKGDITKLSNYGKLEECIMLIRNILKEYKQDTAPIDEVSTAIANITARKELFNRAFKLNVEMPIITYNTMVLSVIGSVSFMIANCIEFIKTPNRDNFTITLNKVAYAKTKSNLIYSNLKSFNKACAKGDVDKGLNHIIDTYVRNEGAIATTAAAVGGALLVGGKIVAAIGAIFTIYYAIRFAIFLFFYAKMRFSEFLEIQADLLQINAQNVENDPNMTDEQKKHIVASQMKIVDFFRKIANKLSINGKKAEVEASKEITKEDNEKSKITDSPDGGSVLF